MSRRWFAWVGGLAAAAVAVLFIAADPASAQMFGRRGSNSGWNGYGYGYGNPYYGGYGAGAYGSGWNNPAYNRGSAYNNWGYNYPGYSGNRDYNRENYPGYSGTWSNAPGYGQATGGYYGEGMQDYSSTTGTTSPAGTSGQAGMMQGGSMDGRVLINVRVSPDAEVWFDDQKTSQTGPFRSFITPALNPDQDFVYHVRARWTENGRQMDKTRRIDVHAGDRLVVNLMGRRQEGGTPSGQSPTYGAEPGNSSEDRALENRDRTLDNRNQNAQENPDRTLNNNTTQPGNATPNNPPTNTENRSATPPNKTNQPPVRQP